MTRQQAWSVGAQKRVIEIRENHGELQAEYRTVAMKAPVLFQQSGLVQTLVFLESRGGDAPKRFLQDLAAVLSGSDPKVLLRRAQQAPLPSYLALSRDALELSTWFRRFAHIELPPTPEGGGE